MEYIIDNEAYNLAEQHIHIVEKLEANGISFQRACDIVVAAHRAGRDPEKDADHYIKLRRAFVGE